MPQLVKGGKYIYGWVSIQPDGRIRIPDEAFDEYHFRTGEKIIMLSGSKTSGGFSIIKPETIKTSMIGQHITDAIGLSKDIHSFTTWQSTPVHAGNRWISWTFLDHDKKICISAELLQRLGLETGGKLLVGRGSGLGPAFIARGQIYGAALKHGHIPTF
jgi:hypothetical protein